MSVSHATTEMKEEESKAQSPSPSLSADNLTNLGAAEQQLFFENLVLDKARVESMATMVPEPLQNYLSSEGFKEECRKQFSALDRNGDGE